MLEQYQDILTIEELCEILKIGRNRAYELLDTGQIKGFRLGRPWKIPKLSVEHYLKKQAGIMLWAGKTFLYAGTLGLPLGTPNEMTDIFLGIQRLYSKDSGRRIRHECLFLTLDEAFDTKEKTRCLNRADNSSYSIFTAVSRRFSLSATHPKASTPIMPSIQPVSITAANIPSGLFEVTGQQR